MLEKEIIKVHAIDDLGHELAKLDTSADKGLYVDVEGLSSIGYEDAVRNVLAMNLAATPTSSYIRLFDYLYSVDFRCLRRGKTVSEWSKILLSSTRTTPTRFTELEAAGLLKRLSQEIDKQGRKIPLRYKLHSPNGELIGIL